MNTFISTTAILGTFMALLLAVFLIILPSRTRTANILLALFLAATAVDISAWFMGDWWAAHPSISMYRPVCSVMQMPFFTGFIWLTCFQDRRLRPLDYAHLLPGLVVFTLVATDTPMPWLRLVFELQYFVYIAISILILWRFDQRLKSRSAKRSPSWRWLAIFVASSLFAHSLFIVRTIFSARFSADLSMTLQALAAFFVLLITLWIAFQALLNPTLFRGGDRQLASAAKATDGESAGDHDRLIAFMEEQRPYLDPDLSLARLARSSGIAAKDLSALINQRYGSHFFDFINSYRIDHAKILLTQSDQSITAIIYASGFNAKSSFNTAFRKHSGKTPSAYRRDHIEK